MAQDITLRITLPSGAGFVEHRRAFAVEAAIGGTVPENACAEILLQDEKGNTVRRVHSETKNEKHTLYVPELTAYAEELDPGRRGIDAFGFPPLAGPTERLREGERRCWFSDTCIKAIIINASDPAHGAVWDDGVGYYDGQGQPYSLLPAGRYRLFVRLYCRDQLLAEAEKTITIGRRECQLICRFNPASHKARMLAWCRERDIAVVDDLMPGYLDPYLGKWYYHMGLLKMYRANDICLYEDTRVELFDYLIDPTSTSYETELAYLQTRGVIGDPARFACWRYDIGEAIVHTADGDLTGRPVCFAPGETCAVCRIDTVNGSARDGIYDIGGSALLAAQTQIDEVHLQPGERFAVMGVLRPWQQDPQDFTLRDDNTYAIANGPAAIRWTFAWNGQTETEERAAGLERFEAGESIGASVYEFYHVFTVPPQWRGQRVHVTLQCLDRRGAQTPCRTEFAIDVENKQPDA